jgi:hypothetical protein
MTPSPSEGSLWTRATPAASSWSSPPLRVGDYRARAWPLTGSATAAGHSLRGSVPRRPDPAGRRTPTQRPGHPGGRTPGRGPFRHRRPRGRWKVAVSPQSGWMALQSAGLRPPAPASPATAAGSSPVQVATADWQSVTARSSRHSQLDRGRSPGRTFSATAFRSPPVAQPTDRAAQPVRRLSSSRRVFTAFSLITDSDGPCSAKAQPRLGSSPVAQPGGKAAHDRSRCLAFLTPLDSVCEP